MLTAVSEIVGVDAVCTTCIYGLKIHNTNVSNTKIETSISKIQAASGLEDLKKEFYLISVNNIEGGSISEYDGIKERFKKTVNEGDILSANRKLKSLKKLCNSSIKIDTLVSGVAESAPESEETSSEVSVGKSNNDKDNMKEIASNTEDTNSNTSSSSSNNSSSNTSSSSTSTAKPTKPSSGNSSSSGSTIATYTHSWV